MGKSASRVPTWYRTERRRLGTFFWIITLVIILAVAGGSYLLVHLPNFQRFVARIPLPQTISTDVTLWLWAVGVTLVIVLPLSFSIGVIVMIINYAREAARRSAKAKPKRFRKSNPLNPLRKEAKSPRA